MTAHPTRRIVVRKKDGTLYNFDADKVSVTMEMEGPDQTHKFEVAFLDLAGLQIAAARQRVFGAAFFKSLVEKFDWRAVRINASRRPDGTLWNVSGQHCGRGAQKKGYTHWPGFIVPTSGYEDECRLYSRFNDANRKKPKDDTLIRVETGDPELAAARALITSEGFRWSPTGREWDAIQDIAFIQELMAAHGADHVRQVLRFIKAAWSGRRCAALKQNLSAISVLLRHWKTDDNRFPWSDCIRVVSEIDPSELTALAAHAGMGSHPDTVRRGRILASYIAERRFNTGRRANRLYWAD